jgi:hypothetical protein
MPIRPEHRHHYRGAAWREVRAAVLARAGNTCECVGECGLEHGGGRCGAPNGATVVRSSEAPQRWERHEACSLCLGGDPECRPVRVVLTVAHLDHDAGTNNLERLRAMCQLCHNRYDSKHRQANAAETRRRKRGQGELWKRS